MTQSKFMNVFRLLVIASVLITFKLPTGKASTSEYVVIDPITGIAIFGYDTVAFFTEQQAIIGSSKHEVEWRGAYWHFASAANADRFKEAPEFYAPRFNGYGALGVADGRAADGNPMIWAIFENQLFFFHSVEARAKWARDVSANVQAAKTIWQDLSKNLSR